MASLPQPKNSLVDVANAVIDALVLGLGVDAAIAAGVAQAPWLAWPIISYIFQQIVTSMAESLDVHLKNTADIVIIRFQNDVRKIEYDSAIDQMKTVMDDPEASDAQKQSAIDAAKNAIRALVNRNR